MTESKESIALQNSKNQKFHNEEQEEEDNYHTEEEEMLENEEQEEKPEPNTKNYRTYREPNELPKSQNLPILKDSNEYYQTYNVAENRFENYNIDNDPYFQQQMNIPRRYHEKSKVRIPASFQNEQNKNDIITQSMSQSIQSVPNIQQSQEFDEQKYAVPVTAKFYKPGLAKVNEKPETILNQNKSNFIQRTIQLTSPKKLERLEKYEQQISPQTEEIEAKKYSDYEVLKNEEEIQKYMEQRQQEIITQQPLPKQVIQENPQNIPDIYIQNNENPNYEEYKYYEDRNDRTTNLSDCYQYKADPHYKLDNCRLHYDYIGAEKQEIPGKVEYHFNLYRKPKQTDYYSDQEAEDPTQKKAYVERNMRKYRLQPVIRYKNKLTPVEVEDELNYNRRLNPSLSQENFEHCTCMEVPCIKRFENQEKPYRFGANSKEEKKELNEEEKYYNGVILGNNKYEPMSFKNTIDGYPVSCRLNHGKHCRHKGGNKPCKYEVYSIAPGEGQNIIADNIDLTVPESVYREEYKQNLNIKKNPRKLRPELVDVLKEKCAPKQPINVATYTKKYSETVEPRFDVNKLGRSVYGNVKYHPYYGGYHTNVQNYHRSANSVVSSYCMKYLEKKFNNGNERLFDYDSDKEMEEKYMQANLAGKTNMGNPGNNSNPYVKQNYAENYNPEYVYDVKYVDNFQCQCEKCMH